MKKPLILIIILFSTIFYGGDLFSQAPQTFKYQAVARDNAGNMLKDASVSFRISILINSPSGTVSYSETHSVTTNSFGLATLEIGKGTVVSGSFTGINWASGVYFIKVELAISGASYTLMGTSQLLSVPYALYAEKSGTAGPTGATGPKGDNGINGATGATGANGINGINGATGAAGKDGLQGPTGATGPKGDNGINGANGATGANGINGINGATGAAGKDGLQGPTGATGPKGDNGINGATGATGANGINGINGETGAAGKDGLQGPTGATGPKGDNGINGSNGATGANGINGINGATGAAGKDGLQGPKGETGATGNDGLQGVTGAKGDTGADGVQGIQGIQGDKGDKGDIGPEGPVGPAGTPDIAGDAGYVPVFTGPSSIGNSVVFQNGNNIGIGTQTPAAQLEINGTAFIDDTNDGIFNIGANSAARITFDRTQIQTKNGANASPLFVNYNGGNVFLSFHSKTSIGNMLPTAKLDVFTFDSIPASYQVAF